MIKPILIPTDKPEYGDLCISPRHDNKIKVFGEFENSYQDECTKVEIILIDTEAEIVEGDLTIDYGCELNHMRLTTIDNTLELERYAKSSKYNIVKVISSTNKAHNLPQLSPQSIQLLINYYNEHKCMPESVGIEYENKKLDLIAGKEYLLDKTGWKINIPETKGVYIKSIKVTDYREEAGFHINAKVLIDPKEETIIGCSENCLYLDKPIKILKLNKQGEVDITIPEVNTTFDNIEGINHLKWIFDRLVNIYGENPDYDYMHKLKAISEENLYTEDEVSRLLSKLGRDLSRSRCMQNTIDFKESFDFTMKFIKDNL